MKKVKEEMKVNVGKKKGVRKRFKERITVTKGEINGHVSFAAQKGQKDEWTCQLRKLRRGRGINGQVRHQELRRL